MPGRLPWTWGRSLKDHDQQRSMTDLEDYLHEAHREITFGPVPGAYATFRFNELNDSPVGTGTQDLILTPFAFRPIAVSVWGIKTAGGADPVYTVQLRYNDGSGATDVMATDKQVTRKELFNKRGDFAVEVIPAEVDFYLHVVSVGDSGSPVIDYLRVTVVGKNASKVEQTT